MTRTLLLSYGMMSEYLFKWATHLYLPSSNGWELCKGSLWNSSSIVCKNKHLLKRDQRNIDQCPWQQVVHNCVWTGYLATKASTFAGMECTKRQWSIEFWAMAQHMLQEFSDHHIPWLFLLAVLLLDQWTKNCESATYCSFFFGPARVKLPCHLKFFMQCPLKSLASPETRCNHLKLRLFVRQRGVI